MFRFDVSNLMICGALVNWFRLAHPHIVTHVETRLLASELFGQPAQLDQ